MERVKMKPRVYIETAIISYQQRAHRGQDGGNNRRRRIQAAGHRHPRDAPEEIVMKEEEDPLAEIRRLRDGLAKRFKGDVSALGDYYRSIPLLPGQSIAGSPTGKKAAKPEKSPTGKRRSRTVKTK